MNLNVIFYLKYYIIVLFRIINVKDNCILKCVILKSNGCYDDNMQKKKKKKLLMMIYKDFGYESMSYIFIL